MDKNTKLQSNMNSADTSISPSTMRALTSFAGFASETYLGKIKQPYKQAL